MSTIVGTTLCLTSRSNASRDTAGTVPFLWDRLMDLAAGTAREDARTTESGAVDSIPTSSDPIEELRRPSLHKRFIIRIDVRQIVLQTGNDVLGHIDTWTIPGMWWTWVRRLTNPNTPQSVPRIPHT